MAKRLAAISIMLVLVLTACSSKSDAEAALCDNINSLTDSIQTLKEVNVITDGTDALKASVADIKDKLQAVADSAKDVFQPDVDAATSAVESIQASIDNVQSGTPVTDEALNISTGLAELKQAGEALIATAKDQDCS